MAKKNVRDEPLNFSFHTHEAASERERTDE